MRVTSRSVRLIHDLPREENLMASDLSRHEPLTFVATPEDVSRMVEVLLESATRDMPPDVHAAILGGVAALTAMVDDPAEVRDSDLRCPRTPAKLIRFMLQDLAISFGFENLPA